MGARKLHGYRAQRGKCFYCPDQLTDQNATKDHLYPFSAIFPDVKRRRSRGGLNRNKVLSCHDCNRQKSDRLPTQAEVDKYIKLYGHKPKFAYLGVS